MGVEWELLCSTHVTFYLYTNERLEQWWRRRPRIHYNSKCAIMAFLSLSFARRKLESVPRRATMPTETTSWTLDHFYRALLHNCTLRKAMKYITSRTIVRKSAGIATKWKVFQNSREKTENEFLLGKWDFDFSLFHHFTLALRHCISALVKLWNVTGSETFQTSHFLIPHSSHRQMIACISSKVNIIDSFEFLIGKCTDQMIANVKWEDRSQKSNGNFTKMKSDL